MQNLKLQFLMYSSTYMRWKCKMYRNTIRVACWCDVLCTHATITYQQHTLKVSKSLSKQNLWHEVRHQGISVVNTPVLTITTQCCMFLLSKGLGVHEVWRSQTIHIKLLGQVTPSYLISKLTSVLHHFPSVACISTPKMYTHEAGSS